MMMVRPKARKGRDPRWPRWHGRYHVERFYCGGEEDSVSVPSKHVWDWSRIRADSRLLVQESLEQAGLDPLPVIGGKRLPELEVLGEDSFSKLGRGELSYLVMRVVRQQGK
jgi:hypothetical protein